MCKGMKLREWYCAKCGTEFYLHGESNVYCVNCPYCNEQERVFRHILIIVEVKDEIHERYED